MIIILEKGNILSKPDFEKAKEDYHTYIKITIDIENETIALGGEYHADAERLLLDTGSKQENIWGGGFDVKSKKISVNAMINLRPKTNYSTDILDAKVRSRFLLAANKIFRKYV